MVADLTGLPTANASLLDEAHRGRRGDDAGRAGPAEGDAGPLRRRRRRAAADASTCVAHPGRAARHRGRRSPTSTDGLPDGDAASACCVQYPGAVRRGPRPAPPSSPRPTSAARSSRRRRRPARADPARRRPASSGADVAVGSAQRFGVPLGFGGPHAGYMAVRAGLERHLPGRLVGVSRRRRRRARPTGSRCRPASSTSAARRRPRNICTAQVLLAVMAVDVRRLPRPRRAAARSRGARTATPRVLAGRAARRRRRGRARRRSSTPCRSRVPGRAAEVVAAAPSSSASTCGSSTPTTSASPSTRPPTATDLAAVLEAFGVDRRPRRRRRRRRTADALPGELRAHQRRTYPPGVPRAPLRDRDAALPAPARPTATSRSTAA